ncbi:glycerol-3-phosphate responsive antiterminator [Pullulanibacillus sp. KACC 23026]|uniref:glycerol-3-phosphate responsive antiterminator n=1 Tax=Pullulanibacillus sp. KACC 23026 TaxID=3028315 RepID=UPI0023AEF522|nr:glycerol-3-phosphate responsive antiterminator [Pullulanibacillus sp. KACC 23026]WEG13812.1 glycerol-3-phosphate responsive antiterminator [Pullulanibacillus sp. KACC 23026]
MERGLLLFHFKEPIILPALRHLEDLEDILNLPQPYMVILDSHIARLQPIIKMARKHAKKVLLHADLINGLKSDEHAAEFLCQEIRPDGLISTRGSVLQVAKRKKLLAIQRIFLLDSLSIETSFRTFDKVKPDLVELLPGVVPNMIKEVSQRTNVPLIAGGLIRTEQDVRMAIQAGATAITTSNKKLWRLSIKD